MLLPFQPATDADFFAAVPAAAAVFVLRGEEGEEPYVAKTSNLRRRLVRLLGPPAELSRRLNLRERVRSLEFWPTGSDFESGLLLYKVLRHEFPETYSTRLRLRPAPLVKLLLDNPYPRVYVTTRLGRLSARSLYYGPFPTRAAAEKFANDSLDFFKLRRCDMEIVPDPAYPGCIYSEMKMCLAPCFAGCTPEEYAAETGRVQGWFDSGGQSLVREITAARDEASARLEFESAAALHARVEKAHAVARLAPEIVTRIDRLSALMVQPSEQPGEVKLFRIHAGAIGDPIPFHVELQGVQHQSMESRIAEALAAAPPTPKLTAQETAEHLAVLKRWYYRTLKTGEIFFADASGELPMRRVVRGVARVFRGEKAETAAEQTAAREYWLARTREELQKPPPK